MQSRIFFWNKLKGRILLMRSKTTLILTFSLVIILLLIMGGCRSGDDVTPSPTAQMNSTQAYQTAEARVTEFYLQTAAASGEGDPTASPEPEIAEASATPTEIAETATPVPPTARPTNTPEPCDLAEPGNPIDVTIPDDTVMTPGQKFNKTWRLVNVGTCTWNNQYAVVWISGEQMGDSSVVFLNGLVGPGQSVDITVPMTAPKTPGSYESYWKLRNSAGVLFGIGENGENVFWVRIKVVNPTATPTATTPPSPTPTETPTETTTP